MIDTPASSARSQSRHRALELQAGQPQAIHRAAAGDEERGGAAPGVDFSHHESVLTIERFDVTRAPEPELEEPAVSVEPAVEREPVLERAPVIERTPLVERAPSFEHAPVVEREAALEREPAAEPEPEPEPEPVMSDPIGAAEREVVVENEVRSEERRVGKECRSG